MTGTADKASLELRKLELELQKVPLEIGKLQAEADQIRSNLRSAWLDRFKVYPAYLTIVVSFAAVVSSYFQFTADQERERKFQTSQQLLTLIGQIGNLTDEVIQINAALTLRNYGEQAAPILVGNLKVDRTAAVYRTMVDSLAGIVESAEKEKAVSFVLDTLGDSAEVFLPQQLGSKNPKAHMIIAHVHALGATAQAASTRGMLQPLYRERFQQILSDARRRLPDAFGSSAERVKQIESIIDDRIRGLST